MKDESRLFQDRAKELPLGEGYVSYEVNPAQERDAHVWLAQGVERQTESDRLHERSRPDRSTFQQ